VRLTAFQPYSICSCPEYEIKTIRNYKIHRPSRQTSKARSDGTCFLLEDTCTVLVTDCYIVSILYVGTIIHTVSTASTCNTKVRFLNSALCKDLSVVWILLGLISFTRINEYSMNEAANEILYYLVEKLQQSCGCSKHNKMEDQSKFEYYMHTQITGRYKMSTYRMMQKSNFVNYQKLYILKNIVVFYLGHLARQ
jgi:hypothetical protein